MIWTLFPEEVLSRTTGEPGAPQEDASAAVPAADLFSFLSSIPGGLDIDRWAARLGDRPCENTLGLVGAATLLFYQAEKNHNPKVNDVWDALVYCSTCISVGYGDIFAHTPVGKIIGSLLMTIGPAMAAKTLDGPPPADADAVQRETLVTLKEILAELRAKPADSPPLSMGGQGGLSSQSADSQL